MERCDAAATRPCPDEWPTRAQTLRPQLQPLSVPEHLDFRVHVDREAVLRAACALPNVFIFIFITYMYVPSSYCCRRVINVQRVTCVANDKKDETFSSQNPSMMRRWVEGREKEKEGSWAQYVYA